MKKTTFSPATSFEQIDRKKMKTVTGGGHAMYAIVRCNSNATCNSYCPDGGVCNRGICLCF